MMVRIAGVGGYVPPIVVTNERLVKAIPGWTPERIEEKTGIRERRHVWEFDEATGRAIVPEVVADPGPSAQMAERALRDALAQAGLQPCDLDGILMTTCTPDQVSFSHDAMILHKRLGLRPEAFAVMHDDGCGGAMFHLATARELILGGQRRTIAVIGANAFAAHLDREVYAGRLPHNGKELGSFLSWYLFGDGAGAIILQGESGSGPSGILGSYAANEHLDLVIRRGGGGMYPPGRSLVTDTAFYVDGQLVATCFAPYLKKAIDGALARSELGLGDIGRFYLHQANKRVLERFIAEVGIPAEKVPMHMERYGNMVSAGTLVLLAEDLRDGHVKLGSGEPILMAALGAGAQYAAHVIRL
ncbi:3-oxoacyl-ACP synthase III family protein [Nannocystis radixulma]|uniref:Ketoacyl-ACP synthase III n=1 Tax=Nannocystis radixulma TaxID=2995305 RepID=A0ABT5BFY6_9BACT|nr:ketoacyl-ACP synthase III [Nannocystis radixulma]MDC0673055.1 ketoacyl-ACP synthase III [Nannocystis radixulma]